MNALNFFRTIGKAEGSSLLILLLIAMPLKYFADMPLAVRIVGSIHGALFVLYLVLAVMLMKRMKWNVDTLIVCAILASIPFGTFIFEKKYASALPMTISDIAYRVFQGADGKSALNDFAQLRIQIFRHYPYLYESDPEYERNYLSKYFVSENTTLLTAWSDSKLVGACISLPLSEDELILQKPFLNQTSILPHEILYVGDSIVHPDFRGFGIGRHFSETLESRAKESGHLRMIALCTVIRSKEDPRQPRDYKSIDAFWRHLGFIPIEGITAEIPWREVGEEKETKKAMQFWGKPLRTDDRIPFLNLNT